MLLENNFFLTGEMRKQTLIVPNRNCSTVIPFAKSLLFYVKLIYYYENFQLHLIIMKSSRFS